MLKLEHVTKLYGENRGINNLSLNVKKGEIVGILGSNGSGKTTTFRILLGLIEKDEGKISYEGKEIDPLNKRLFGYLPEERSMLRDLKVKDQITYLARLKKMSEAEINEKMDYWLDYLHISQYRNQRIIELSKGNQQKVQLICSLIHDGAIQIFDEPLNGLDLENVDLFKQLCWKLKREGKIILISSHQYNNIEDLCDSVVYLYQGKCLFKGKLDYLKRQQKVRYLTILHGDIEDFEGENGVVNIQKVVDKLIIQVANEEDALKLMRKCFKMGITDIKCEMVSLQMLIKEALNKVIK